MNEDMKLPEGKTCADCVHVKRCTSMFGVNTTDTECDFGPSRFVEANRPVDRVVIPHHWGRNEGGTAEHKKPFEGFRYWFAGVGYTSEPKCRG